MAAGAIGIEQDAATRTVRVTWNDRAMVRLSWVVRGT